MQINSTFKPCPSLLCFSSDCEGGCYAGVTTVTAQYKPVTNSSSSERNQKEHSGFLQMAEEIPAGDEAD